MLGAYVDDSGNSPEDNSGHFVLAGYVMRVPLWEEFSDRWKNELDREPRIECFKMYDAEHGCGYCEGMPSEFRLLKVNELSQVIHDYDPLAITASLKWRDYQDIAQGNVPAKMDSPYAVLFYQIMRSCHEFQIALNKEDPSIGYQKVDFAFDEQGQVGLRALQWYAALKPRVPEPYQSMMGGSPIFRRDDELVALQSADMLAWQVHRDLEFPAEKRPILEKITQHLSARYVDRVALHSFVELAQRVTPEELANGF
jgi:hypothetical protein